MNYMSAPNKSNYNILMLSKDLGYPGGVVSVVSMLMKHFSEKIECEHFRIGSRTFAPNRPVALLYPFADCLRLFARILIKKFDVVFFNTSLDIKAVLRDGFFLACLSFAGYKNSMIFIHGWDLGLASRIKKNFFLRTLFRAVFKRSQILIVLASQFKKTLVEIGLPENRIHVLTTMFEATSFANYKFAVKKTKPRTVLFLSRFQREKGIFETIEALPCLLSRYPDIHLILAGDGPELENAKKLVRELNISGHVTFTGYIRGVEKINAYKAADIFLLPTYYREGCPVSLIEAMAAGLAVITTPVAGIPDIVSEKENGILLSDTKPLTIALAIEKLLEDPHQLNSIRRNNNQKAFKKYEATAVTHTVEQLIYKVIENRNI